jgi:L-malate glycosyltransferase
MKVLWLTNRVVEKKDNGLTGSWIYALIHAIKRSAFTQVANITMDSVAEITYDRFDNFEQWRIPNKAKKANGLPKDKYEKLIIKIIKDFNPHIIHVWGVENFWGLVTKRLRKEFPILIEIQGLKKDIAPVYSGELSNYEKLRSIGIKEFLKFDTIYNRKRKYRKWGLIEEDIIKSHTFFSTHSDWAEAKVKEFNPSCIMFKNERLLRPEFYLSRWTVNDSVFIYTSAGYSAPFKGLLTLIKAINILKHKYPNIVLNIAGGFQFNGVRRDGYMQFLKMYIKKIKIENNICFVGSLNAKEIVGLVKKSALAVFPSFVESYGLAFAECMALGIPLVASYNGGFSYLGRDNENVLFFPAGDVAMCAYQMDKILSNKNLANFLSGNARESCISRNSENTIVNNQISIYQRVCETFSKNLDDN